MLVAGDEISRTQQGNNNAYCQDNEISWLNWNDVDQDLLKFTQKLIKLRNEHSVFSRKNWFKGVPVKDNGIEDIAWFLPDGTTMTEEHWNQNYAKSVAIFLNGKGLHAMDSKGNPVVDDSFYVIFNAHYEAVSYQIPGEGYGNQWDLAVDTSQPSGSEQEKQYQAGETIQVEGRSVVALQHKR